jgi:hypothetical protein
MGGTYTRNELRKGRMTKGKVAFLSALSGLTAGLVISRLLSPRKSSTDAPKRRSGFRVQRLAFGVKYRLDDLLAKCEEGDFNLTEEDRAFLDAPPAGRELI